MKIAICDDQPLMCEIVDKHLKEYERENQIKLDVKIFYSGTALLSENNHYDIIFLDIELEQEHGIDVAEQYSKEHSCTQTGYVTKRDKARQHGNIRE